MKFHTIAVASFLTGGSFFFSGTKGHGLMEDPPSRNWICGVVTKPDHVLNNVALTPECGEAFNFRDGGYQFMSVLTHDVGRIGVNPLPNNVCGFDSETWFGGSTPWDAPFDWPTTPMAAGRNEIKWNIQWGTHFSDTEDFRYWITKSDFQFDPNRELAWTDFEDAPFCELFYSDVNPNGNPDVIPLTSSAQFRTFCDIPQRDGHHVIYGEWGRNQDTFERFHGCIDITGTDGPPPPREGGVQAFFTYQPNTAIIEGEGLISFDASSSSGENLSYSWSVTTSGDESIYSLDDPSAVAPTLTLAEPSTFQQLMISLLVSNSVGSSTYSVQVSHYPFVATIWMDFGQLQPTTNDLAFGTRVSFRAVAADGAEFSWPSSPLIVDDTNRWATNWPVALSNVLESENAPVAVGVLDSNTDEVNVQWSTTANRVFGHLSEDFTLVQLQLNPPPSGPTLAPAPTPTPAPIQSTTPDAGSPTMSPDDGGPDGGDDVCFVNVRSDSNNPWHGGIDIGFDVPSVVLDFSNTGLDLSQVNPQSGVFTSLSIVGNTLILTKPSWLSQSNPGYLGIGGNNVAALGTFTTPECFDASLIV